MKKLARNLLAVVILGTLSSGVLAQKKGEDKRPPKEPVKVITNDRKDNNKPPQDRNQPKPDRKKKP